MREDGELVVGHARRARRWPRPAGVNGSVSSTAVAIPRVSSARPSCIVHVLHDPQSPIAVTTTSACSTSAAQRRVVGGHARVRLHDPHDTGDAVTRDQLGGDELEDLARVRLAVREQPDDGTLEARGGAARARGSSRRGQRAATPSRSVITRRLRARRRRRRDPGASAGPGTDEITAPSPAATGAVTATLGAATAPAREPRRAAPGVRATDRDEDVGRHPGARAGAHVVAVDDREIEPTAALELGERASTAVEQVLLDRLHRPPFVGEDPCVLGAEHEVALAVAVAAEACAGRRPR